MILVSRTASMTYTVVAKCLETQLVESMTKHVQEAQLLLGWPTVLPYSRRLCKSCVVHSCKSVQPFSRNVDDKEISIAASRALPELIQNVNRSSHGHSTPSLKISCKSVQPFCLDTKRHRRQTDRRHPVTKARPIVRSAKKRSLPTNDSLPNTNSCPGKQTILLESSVGVTLLFIKVLSFMG